MINMQKVHRSVPRGRHNHPLRNLFKCPDTIHLPANINKVYLVITLSWGLPAEKWFIQESGERVSKGIGVVWGFTVMRGQSQHGEDSSSHGLEPELYLNSYQLLEIKAYTGLLLLIAPCGGDRRRRVEIENSTNIKNVLFITKPSYKGKKTIISSRKKQKLNRKGKFSQQNICCDLQSPISIVLSAM